MPASLHVVKSHSLHVNPSLDYHVTNQNYSSKKSHSLRCQGYPSNDSYILASFPIFSDSDFQMLNEQSFLKIEYFKLHKILHLLTLLGISNKL